MLEVLIVEDDIILLDFLVQEVSNLINVPAGDISRVSSVKDATVFLKRNKPDWLLLDLHLSDGSGIEIAEIFVSHNPQGRILILTAQSEQYLLPAKLLTSVHSLINKADGLAPLRDAIWELSRELDSNLPDLTILTPRQIEFLRLIGDGLDTAMIAKKLQISFSTAQTHRRQITKKLGLKGSALVTLARNLPKEM